MIYAVFDVTLHLGASVVSADSNAIIQDLSVTRAALVGGAFVIVGAKFGVLGGAIVVDAPLGGTFLSIVAVGSGLLGVYLGAFAGGIGDLGLGARVTKRAICITNTISGGLQCLALVISLDTTGLITEGAQSTAPGRNAFLAIIDSKKKQERCFNK